MCMNLAVSVKFLPYYIPKKHTKRLLNYKQQFQDMGEMQYEFELAYSVKLDRR